MGEAPFIVVPCGNLDELASGNLRERRVEGGAVGVVVEVAGNERKIVVAENAAESFGFGSRLDDGVDFFNGGFALGDEGKVDHADVDRRNADCVAVEKTVEFRKNKTDCSSGASLRRDHGLGGSTSAAHVLVEDVGKNLVVRVGMDRGHEAAFNAESFMERLDERSQAVGRAGSVGNNEVGRLENILVDAVDDGGVGGLARSGKENLFGAGVEVNLALFLGVECAGAFENDVDVEILPWEFARIAGGEGLDAVAVDDQIGSVDFNGAVEASVAGVEADEVSVRIDVAWSVDGNDLNVARLAGFIVGAQNVAADSSKTIDCDADGHFLSLLKVT